MRAVRKIELTKVGCSQSGFDLPLFFKQLFANNISSLFGIDFIISSIVLWLFVFQEGKRIGMKHLWIYVAANLTVGISLSLPLFLLMRQRKLDERIVVPS